MAGPPDTQLIVVPHMPFEGRCRFWVTPAAESLPSYPMVKDALSIATARTSVGGMEITTTVKVLVLVALPVVSVAVRVTVALPARKTGLVTTPAAEMMDGSLDAQLIVVDWPFVVGNARFCVTEEAPSPDTKTRASAD